MRDFAFQTGGRAMTPEAKARIAQMGAGPCEARPSSGPKGRSKGTPVENGGLCHLLLQGEKDSSPQGQEADDVLNGDENIRPSDSGLEPVDAKIVKACTSLDHSDTDNGKRLLNHFGADLRVLKQAEARTPTYAAFRGNFWDVECGNLYAHQVAQKIGGRIGLEADYLALTRFEQKHYEDGERAARDLAVLERRKMDWTSVDRARAQALEGTVKAAKLAKEALNKRQQARRKFAVSSKNAARIANMLICAAPGCAVEPDAFNPDPYVLATKGHTLRFLRERDDECPDPNACRWKARVEAVPGHRREDMLTRYVPHVYDPQAQCPNWQAFLQEFLPDSAVRDFVQTFSGLGLLGRTVQKVVFHYGLGANGKSVFLETLMRVLGPLAVGLPAESITGQRDRAAGGASPDLARLYGARALRVLELPADKPLHEDLVKKLTGGEKIPVRTLFKGYFDFTPVFSCHMSGNGYPRVDGTDNGIWRRMAVVHWPVTIEKERQREFEDVLASFAPEYSGILNWLIEGALRFIESGLPEPPAIAEATQEYRDEMDPVGQFVRDCVVRDVQSSITRKEAYSAYEAWAFDGGLNPISQQRFKKAFVSHGFAEKKVKGVRCYANCCLHDVPSRPVTPIGSTTGRGD
jgi:putative DNA primase/helicase